MTRETKWIVEKGRKRKRKKYKDTTFPCNAFVLQLWTEAQNREMFATTAMPVTKILHFKQDLSYTCCIQVIYQHGVTMETFADDTVLIVEGNSIEEVTCWFKRWRIKPNEAKSVYVNFN